MARALVVDDSKLARIALKKQLENYQLEVALADSGEEAIDFLSHESADVIFMDHTMPGMDGLSAVRVLKSNPRTATIPVMMYTSKEGEVYVSQARALGAVDVLPKQVQPGVLYGMLLKLGLVTDRRASAADDDTANLRIVAGNGNADSEARPAPDIASLMAGVLEDQRTTMRSDLNASQKSFVQQIVSEVEVRQETHFNAVRNLLDERRPSLALPALTGALAIAAAFFAVLFFTAGTEQPASSGINPGRAANVPVATAAETDGEPETADVATLRLYNSLAWALNEGGDADFDTLHFDRLRALQLTDLLDRLSESGFRGAVVIASHLGEFCLTVDAAGLYQAADETTPMSACSLIGHPLDGSASVEERQTTAFATLLEDVRRAYAPDITVDVIAYDRVNSEPRVPYPVDPANAGEWNAIARRNHRVEYTLVANLR